MRKLLLQKVSPYLKILSEWYYRTKIFGMGQALSIGARGGSIFSRTKYANKDLGVKLDHVVGDDNQRMSARKLNNSIQRKTEAAIYFYGKNTSRSQARAESAPQKKRTNPDRNTRSPATTSASNFPL